MDDRVDITELLEAAQAGDARAQRDAFSLIYTELRTCARRLRGVAAGTTLTPTALVHETYLRLTQKAAGQIRDRGHFFALAGRAMRQILIDHARRRQSIKRGGECMRSDEDIELAIDDSAAMQALELDSALTALASHDSELAHIVEWHFFAGLNFGEIAELQQRHERTVRRDWELARAFLRRAMHPETPT